MMKRNVSPSSGSTTGAAHSAITCRNVRSQTASTLGKRLVTLERTSVKQSGALAVVDGVEIHRECAHDAASCLPENNCDDRSVRDPTGEILEVDALGVAEPGGPSVCNSIWVCDGSLRRSGPTDVKWGAHTLPRVARRVPSATEGPAPTRLPPRPICRRARCAPRMTVEPGGLEQRGEEIEHRPSTWAS